MSDYCSHGFAIGDPCYDCLRTENAAIAAMVDEITATLGERYGVMTTVEGVRAAMADLAALEKALSDNRVLLKLITGPTGPISRFITRAERAEAELEAMANHQAAVEHYRRREAEFAALDEALSDIRVLLMQATAELNAKEARIEELEGQLSSTQTRAEDERRGC